jgi:hypothetical protein
MNATIAAQIEAAIATLQARGEPVTNNRVRAVAQVGRNSVKRHLMQWRAQHRGGKSPVAPALPVAAQPLPARPAVARLPTPRPAPVALLLELRARCATDDETWRRLERETQQHQQDRAQHWMEFRHARAEAKRLGTLYLSAYCASRLALYAGNEAVQEETERLRSHLVGFVGDADVRRLEAGDKPWWVTTDR